MSARHTRPRDLARAAKELFRSGLGLFSTADALGDALGENTTLVEAWASATRLNQVPLWILASPGLPRALRAYLLAGLEALAERGPAAGAHTAEAQTHVVCGTIGVLLTAIAAALAGDQRWDPDEARGAIPHLEQLIEQLQALHVRLQAVALAGMTPRGSA